MLALASDEDLDVRTDVVNALRFYPSPEADAVVFAALDDPERLVGAAALAVIEGYRPDDAAIERLAARVIAEDVHPELGGPIVSVLGKRALEHPAPREALAVLYARTDDARSRRRIRRMLGEAPGQPEASEG